MDPIENDLDFLNSESEDTPDDLQILDDTAEDSAEVESEETEADSSDDGSADLGENDGEGEEVVEEKVEEKKPEVKEALSDDDLAGPPNFKRPTIGEIKKNFPDFFKKHPEMSECILRERHFTELFPTLNMAKQAAADSERFQNVSAQLVEGNVESLFDALGESSSRLVENFLPTLYRKDAAKFRQITAPIMQTALRSMANHENENYRHAADYVSHFLFGSVVKELPNAPQEDPEVRRIKEEREREKAEFSQRALRTAIEQVGSSVERTIANLNEAALKPAKLPEKRFEKINNEILDKVQELVNGDIAHSKWMRQLWEGAKRDGYSTVSIGKIKNAMLSRTKQLLPKARAEVLKDYGISLRSSGNQNQTPVVKAIPGNRPASKTSSSIGKESLRSKSDREILDMD